MFGAPVDSALDAKMIYGFVHRRFKHFGAWWRAPASRGDRALGATIGGLGCLWIGVLGRLFFDPMPVSLSIIGWWALGSVAAGVALGIFFPKVTTCVCYPFSTFGVGS
jgi:hypothetical protein